MKPVTVALAPQVPGVQPVPAASIPLPVGHDAALARGAKDGAKFQSPSPTVGVLAPVEPPPVPLWSQLGVEPGRPAARPQSRDQALGAVRNSKETHIALWTPAEPRGVTLPRSEALRKIENSGESAFLVVPLPGEDRSKWQKMIDQTTAALALTDWLGDPSRDDAWRREWAARRAADQEAAISERELVNRAFFRALLPELRTKPAPAPVAPPLANRSN